MRLIVREGKDGRDQCTGYAVVPGRRLTEDDMRQIAAAVERHEQAMMPAPQSDVLMALARLRAMTRAPQAGDDDLKFALGVYAEELATYPGDVVLSVLRDWPKRSMWWPSWHELCCELEDRTVRRRGRLEVLRRLASGDIPPSIEDAREAREAEAARIAESRTPEVRAKIEATIAQATGRRHAAMSTAQRLAQDLPEGLRARFWEACVGGMTPEEAAESVKQPHASEAV